MKKIVLILSILVLFVAVFISCEGENGSSDNEKNDGAVRLYAIENLSDYVVVRGESSSETEKTLATSLRNAINEATGANIGIKTDYYNSKYEILVGKTRRQQSIDAAMGFGNNDYTIKKDGDKIVVIGGSDKALSDAVDFFMAQFIDSERKVVKIPSGNGFTKKTEKLFDKLTVEGVDISDFSVFNKTSLNIDGFLDDISLLFNAEIESHSGEMSGSKHYIIIEATELIADKFSIKIEDGNIVINGSSHSVEAALDAFKNDFIPSIGARTYDLTAADNFEGSTGKKELYTKDQLMAVIEKVYADPDHIIIGEQVCGNPKGAHNIAESIELFKTATGQMPGIMGIDLACYGLDLPGTDDATWSAYICDIVDFVAEGGIITASAHWANPSGYTEPYNACRGNLGNENSLAAYEKAFTDLITEGTEYNTEFKKELETNARFFKALEGNGVSIIWRPLHEANGNWFWFCVGQQASVLDAKYIVDLWHYIYDYFENECGLNNLVWCYAPNTSANVENDPRKSTMSTTYLYPGDEYCDMVGVDWYTEGKVEIAENDNYLLLAEKSGKPAAITEFGTGGSITTEDPKDQMEVYNAMTLYYELYDLIDNGYSFTYLITWYNRYGITYLGLGDEFMETEMTLNQSEVKALFESLK